ncbi:lytic polysaccharide monooxygenase [Actinomadura sp. SCN-SB]|uniref:lytic polysaccharide monooxygenase auxiliary activity family 9 protein n=1 Tax=Actinomadura sp. SCN-SB TaxID=3373092 RepID=UPI0037514CD9
MTVRLPAVVAGLVLVVVAAAPAATAVAGTHGAMSSPPSRAAACSPEGGAKARSRACRAAASVSGAAALADFDNVRVPGVRGRDRKLIPDGELCSAGIARFRGLDLPRSDWPATRLTSGARHTFRYRVTIPHRGGLRMYVTRDGYRPTRKLTWSALEPKPFLTVQDPPRRGGSYVFTGRLPKGKSGRHLVYTIWQTSDTPDTYYSCSDVVFAEPKSKAKPVPKASGKPSAAASRTAPTTQDAPQAETAPEQPRTRNVAGTRDTTMMAAGEGALLLAAAGATIVLLRRRREL